MSAPSLLFYGDDFTGATDALATAAGAGLRTMLFLSAAAAQRAADLTEYACIGIAGAARSMPPDEMRAELAPVAALATRVGARVLHYKTCSTFDSAPAIGSIGVAVATLRPAVRDTVVSVVGGQPNLERYCLFGNLFAAAGQGGEVYRVDRHPTMSVHPVTPMNEADLRRHLAAQGMTSMGLVPWTLYAGDAARLQRHIEALTARHDAILWDVGTPDHLEAIGAALNARAAQHSLLAVGPSSVIAAVAGSTSRPVSRPLAQSSGPVLVLAGSLSPVSARQVAAAQRFDRIDLDAPALASGDGAVNEAARAIAGRLAQGRNVVACTTRPSDGATDTLAPRAVAAATGRVLARVLDLQPLKRVGIAGGDTSSHAMRALDAWGLTYLQSLSPGVALCRLHSARDALDGTEVMLKGGQMGDDALLDRLVAGD